LSLAKASVVQHFGKEDFRLSCRLQNVGIVEPGSAIAAQLFSGAGATDLDQVFLPAVWAANNKGLVFDSLL